MTLRADYLLAAVVASAALVASPAIGAEAPPANWQQMIDAKLESYLKDPYSAVKKVTRGPRYGSVREDAYTTWTGWAVCYSINAKNSYGAFAGARDFVFVVGAEGVIGMLDDPENLWTGGIMKRECGMPADEPTPTTKGPEEHI